MVTLCLFLLSSGSIYLQHMKHIDADNQKLERQSERYISFLSYI